MYEDGEQVGDLHLNCTLDMLSVDTGKNGRCRNSTCTMNKDTAVNTGVGARYEYQRLFLWPLSSHFPILIICGNLGGSQCMHGQWRIYFKYFVVLNMTILFQKCLLLK